MWARVARFEGDPADVDARVERLRAFLDAGDLPPELADSKLLMLADRASGAMLGVTLFDSEEAMRPGRRGHEPGHRPRPGADPPSSSTRCRSTPSSPPASRHRDAGLRLQSVPDDAVTQADETSASRRGACPTRRASTSATTPTARCSTSARPARCGSAWRRTSQRSRPIARARSSSRAPLDRADRGRQRERGAAARAAADQAPPAAAQRRGCATTSRIRTSRSRSRDEYPRVLFTRERHRAGVRYFGPYASAQKVRTTLETLNKIFPYRPCEGPAPGRRSGVPCLDYHIGRCAAPCVGPDHARGLPGGDRRRDRLPRGPHEQDRARPRAAHAARPRSGTSSRRPRARATGSRPCATSASARRVAVGHGHLRRGRARGRGRRRQRAAARRARRAHRGAPLALPRERRRRGRGRAARALPARLLRRAGRHPAARLRPHRGRRRRSDRGLPLPAARRRGRGARRRARRQAPRRRDGRCATPSSACATTCCARSARARAASRGSRSCARRSTSRRCRSASSASTSRTCRTRTPSPRWSSSRTARPSAPTTAASASGTAGGQDDFRSLAEAVTRRFERHRRVDEDGYDRSFATLPNLLVIDGGKGQLGAALDAMRELRPAARRGRLARQARGGGLPARARPAGAPAARVAGPAAAAAGSATRPTASRCAATARARGRGQTASLLDTLPGVGPRAPARADRALRRRRPRCSTPRAPSSRPSRASRGRRARSTTTCTARDSWRRESWPGFGRCGVA